MRNLHFFLYSLFVLNLGCDKLSNGVVNYIDFPEHTPQVSATVIISQDASQINALIFSSSSVQDSLGSLIIDNAVITISDVNDVPLYVLDENNLSDDMYTLDLNEDVMLSTDDYKLNIDVPDLDNVSATTDMPRTPDFDLEYFPNFDTIPSPFEGEYIRDLIEIDFKNDVTIKESFMVYLQIEYRDVNTEELFQNGEVRFETEGDPRLTFNETVNGLMISDATVLSATTGLENISIYFRVKEEIGFFEINSITCRIEAVSVSLANHYTSINDYLTAGGNPFAEPDLLYSNLSSGFGCFGMSNSVLIELK